MSSFAEPAEGSASYLWPREEKNPSEILLLCLMCNTENQLSELCLLPWSSDKNTQGESESTAALPPVPALSKFSSSPHPSPNPLYFLHLQRHLAHLSPAVGTLW